MRQYTKLWNVIAANVMNRIKKWGV